MSQSAIVRKLNSLGIPNPTKYKNMKGQNLKNPKGNDGLWSVSSVRRILTNEVYLGRMIQGRDEVINYKVHKSRRVPEENWFKVDGTHEPIVSPDTFQKTRKLMSLNVREGALGVVYPLGGLLKCGGCGKAMSRKSARNNVYYCCRTYREKGKQFCGLNTIREDILFDTVLEAINFQILQMSDMKALMRRVCGAQKKPVDYAGLEAKIKSAEKLLAGEVAVFDKAYYDYVKDIISEEQFKRIRELCEKRQRELEKKIGNLASERQNQCKADEARPFRAGDFQKNQRMGELTRAVAFGLIESIYVNKDKSIEINFKFSDQYCVYFSRRQARL
jgi:hypothetical protein